MDCRSAPADGVAIVGAGLKVESIVLGTCFIAVGLAWLLANFGQLDVLATLRRYWPVSLIYWGILELVNVRLVRARRGEA